MTQSAVDTKSKKNGGTNEIPPAAADVFAKAPEAGGFRKVELDRPTFKAELFLTKAAGSLVETYEGPICQGHVVGHVEMPEMLDESTGDMRKWFCYVLELTAPTKGVDRDVVKDLGIGDQILVAETAKIKQAIPADVANHPTHMLHVQIKPISRAPMADDKTRKIWHTEVFVHANPVPRKQALSGNSVIASMRASAKTAQLGG